MGVIRFSDPGDPPRPTKRRRRFNAAGRRAALRRARRRGPRYRGALAKAERAEMVEIGERLLESGRGLMSPSLRGVLERFLAENQ